MPRSSCSLRIGTKTKLRVVFAHLAFVEIDDREIVADDFRRRAGGGKGDFHVVARQQQKAIGAVLVAYAGQRDAHDDAGELLACRIGRSSCSCGRPVGTDRLGATPFGDSAAAAGRSHRVARAARSPCRIGRDRRLGGGGAVRRATDRLFPTPLLILPEFAPRPAGRSPCRAAAALRRPSDDRACRSRRRAGRNSSCSRFAGCCKYLAEIADLARGSARRCR